MKSLQGWFSSTMTNTVCTGGRAPAEAIATWAEAGGMRRVHADVPDLVIGEIDNSQVVFLLQHFHSELDAQCKRNGLRPTLGVRVGIDDAP